MKYPNIYGVITTGALLCAPMWVAAQTVSSFTVVNADTGVDIATFASSGTINVKDTPNINLRANASSVKSVVFTDATTTTRIENTAPYAYKGNASTTYFKWAPSVGTYVIKAKPFAGSNGTGTAGAVATLTLNITNDAAQSGPAGSWSQVAVEWANFTVAKSVRVRYGFNNSWIEKTVSGQIPCTNTFFGLDPLPKVRKVCQVFSSGTQVPVIPTTQTFKLDYQAAPADNPLKGFITYYGSSAGGVPQSMEWFYLPLKALQKDYKTFDWTQLEKNLENAKARGRHVAFRIYLDYPGSESGIPDFLAHVKKYRYTDHGNNKSVSPDYSDPDLKRALLNFIEAFGKKYDNDPRIGFITAGLLGFWGEWHTYTYSPDSDVPEVPDSLFLDVLDAYTAAFPNTMIQARGAVAGLDIKKHPRLGFHDDSFALSTLPPTNWHFWPRLLNAKLGDNWKTAPMGGEVYPGIQGCVWNNSCTNPKNENFDLAVATTHASWLIYWTPLSATGEALRVGMEDAQSLGYTLHVPTASVTSSSVGQALSGSVTIENRGVAPFYYPWTVQMAARDSTGKLYNWPQKWDLRVILPGSPSLLNFNITNPGLSAGNYTLLIGIPNPMEGGRWLKFGNTTQDKDQSGWLTLGSFDVK